MQSIPLKYDPDRPYGVDWRTIFKIRNTVALRFCERFDHRIPEEEWFSAGNEGIVEALEQFDPAGRAAFTSYLWLVLSRKMRTVLEKEWQGFIRRTYTGTKANHRRVSQTYVPPEFVEPDETLPVPTSALESAVLISEIVEYLRTHERPANATFVLEHSMGYTPTEMEHRHGAPHSSIVNRVRHVRERLTAWCAA